MSYSDVAFLIDEPTTALTDYAIAVASVTSLFPAPPRPWLLAGLFLTVSGVLILRSDLLLDHAFIRVDLYHCIQLMGLYCLWRGPGASVTAPDGIGAGR